MTMDLSPSSPAEDKIVVAVCDDVCVAKIEGRGSFKISGLLRDFGHRMVDSRHRPLMLDLRNCIGMDSTFMGTIAYLACKFKQSQSPRIFMVNLSDKNHQLASTLGLQYMVNLHLLGGTLPEGFDIMHAKFCGPGTRLTAAEPETKRQQAEIMLEAHESLANLTPDNREKFQDVIDYLKHDLQDKSGTLDSNGM